MGKARVDHQQLLGGPPLCLYLFASVLPNDKTRSNAYPCNHRNPRWRLACARPSVEQNGTVYIGKTEVTIERLRGLLAGIAEQDVERRIYIRADKGLSYGSVMQVMAAVNQSGFTRVALITDSN